LFRPREGIVLAVPQQREAWKEPIVIVGRYRIRLLDAGRFKLDGGAMFGLIPKPVWTRLTPADEHNRIELALRSLLIESDETRIIVESGAGNKYSDKERAMFDFADRWLLDAVTEEGVDPAQIDHVILTHLHFDHGGGVTQADKSGNPVATFPKAKVHPQKQEWQDALAGHGVMTVTYRPENLAPLDVAGLVQPIDGSQEVAPGVRVMPTPGHTRGHQSVVIEDGGQTAVFIGDLMPTAAHVGLRYNMAYDLDPVGNMHTKRGFLERAAAEGWTLLMTHDPHHPAYTVSQEGPEKFTLAPVDASALAQS
jgi:glyoxylase-like metal-dependent hydrolase (beta-lactamase superfamily II)